MNVTLPGGLAGPLSFPGRPFAGCSPVVLLALLGLAWLAYRWWWKRRRSAAPAGQPKPPKHRPLPHGSDPVTEIEARHLADETFRLGCHELAGVLRSGAKWSIRDHSRGEPAVLTARELEQVSDNQAATRLMSMLAGQRFQRETPSRSEFRTACSLVRAFLEIHSR